jgi:hypothetical protein
VISAAQVSDAVLSLHQAFGLSSDEVTAEVAPAAGGGL